MIIQASTRARLLFRVDPVPLESPRGYLCRVANAHRYNGPHWLVQLAGLPAEKVEREDGAASIAHVLRLQPEQWLTMCYRRVGGPQRFQQRSFYGKNVGAYHLNFGRPRVCPACLRERSVWWTVWDLCLVAVCPVHRCLLLDQCPSCRKALNWHRPAVHECRCGLDLRTLTSKTADTDSVTINAAIYRAAGFSPGTAAEQDINRYDFPRELTCLSLGSLLVLLRFLGSIEHEDRPRRSHPADSWKTPWRYNVGAVESGENLQIARGRRLLVSNLSASQRWRVRSTNPEAILGGVRNAKSNQTAKLPYQSGRARTVDVGGYHDSNSVFSSAVISA